MQKVNPAKKIGLLVISLVVLVEFTILGGICLNIKMNWLRILVTCLVYLSMTVLPIVFMKSTGLEFKIDIKNKRQYRYGLLMWVGLSLLLSLGVVIFGPDLIGTHQSYTALQLIGNLLYFILIIGPVEEFIFRVYVQETLVSLFSRHKWIGVVISSLLFGLWHIINGSLLQVLIAFVVGLIFGLMKHYIKDCTWISVSLAHGLYNFFNCLMRMIMI